MAVEANAEQVEDLALEEIGAGQMGVSESTTGIVAGKLDLQTETISWSRDREQVIHDLKARLARMPVDAVTSARASRT